MFAKILQLLLLVLNDKVRKIPKAKGTVKYQQRNN